MLSLEGITNQEVDFDDACVSLILKISQTQILIHWYQSCSYSLSEGKSHSKFDHAWRNQRGMSQTRKNQGKFQKRAQERNAQV